MMALDDPPKMRRCDLVSGGSMRCPRIAGHPGTCTPIPAGRQFDMSRQDSDVSTYEALTKPPPAPVSLAVHAFVIALIGVSVGVIALGLAIVALIESTR